MLNDEPVVKSDMKAFKLEMIDVVEKSIKDTVDPEQHMLEVLEK